ncbi:MAG: SCP2 sterol-binding domain-containing protein [Pseudomonadota bacterium]
MTGPLDIVLRPLNTVFNRNIAESTPAAELARELEGRLVAIRVRDTALATYFAFKEGQLELTTETADEPDVIVCGSIIALGGMMQGRGAQSIREGDVELSGDAATAQRFQKLLEFIKPDPEEELSRFVGDAAAHQLSNVAASVSAWARGARTTMGENLRDYFQEESRELPTYFEFEAFTGDVARLRDDIDRLIARVERFAAKAQPSKANPE